MILRLSGPVSRVHLMGALMLLMLVTTQAFAADTIQANSAEGYGRLLITLDPTAHAQPSLEGGVLKIAFDRKVTFDPASIAAQLPAYVTGGRADADGKTLRFALAQTFKLHSSISGNKTAVDLVPDNFDGTPPDLPKQVVAAPKPVDIATLPTLRVRAGIYARYSRVVFDWPKKTAYSIFPSKGHLTVRFQGVAQPDFSAIERLAPPWVKTAGWRIDGQNLVVELATDAGSKHKDLGGRQPHRHRHPVSGNR